MSDIRKLLDIIQETTVAGSVATVAAPLGSTQKRNTGVYSEETTNECDSDEKEKSPREFGLWKNSALIASEQKKKRQEKKLEVKESAKEEKVKEVAAPGQEDWIKKNKERFVKQYGKDKGMNVLYATAWKRSKKDESQMESFERALDKIIDPFLSEKEKTLREYDEGIRSNNPQGIPESKENDPYEQGWRAFFRKQSSNENPYEEGTDEYNQWKDGYEEGQAQPRHYDESISEDSEVMEAEYRGRTVTLNKPFLTPGGPKKRSVYVKNKKGNVVKVNFGDPNMRIKKSSPKHRKSFRARHKCDTAKDKTKARYWSCKAW